MQAGDVIFDVPRALRAQLSEIGILATMTSGRGPGSVVVDVGAHFGDTVAPFIQMGWTAHAFEPDPSNRAILEQRWGGDDRVTIDPRAVTETDEENLTLWTSPQSTGITTLTPFHETHTASETVTTVRLDTYLDSNGIEAVDALKVDVEGHDLFVLRSLDWDRFQPLGILVEFEDNKTVQLGHTVGDLAEELVSLGYEVWVSEWWPIVQYGTTHSWRRLARWPQPLTDDAWGNLLAFHGHVPSDVMREVGSRFAHA